MNIQYFRVLVLCFSTVGLLACNKAGNFASPTEKDSQTIVEEGLNAKCTQSKKNLDDLVQKLGPIDRDDISDTLLAIGVGKPIDETSPKKYELIKDGDIDSIINKFGSIAKEKQEAGSHWNNYQDSYEKAGQLVVELKKLLNTHNQTPYNGYLVDYFDFKWISQCSKWGEPSCSKLDEEVQKQEEAELIDRASKFDDDLSNLDKAMRSVDYLSEIVYCHN